MSKEREYHFLQSGAKARGESPGADRRVRRVPAPGPNPAVRPRPLAWAATGVIRKSFGRGSGPPSKTFSGTDGEDGFMDQAESLCPTERNTTCAYVDSFWP